MIRGNTVAQSGTAGILIGPGDVSDLSHNLVARGDSGIVLRTSVDPSRIRCNDVWANPGGNWIGGPDPTGTDGNIALDPLFCDPEQGDLHVAYDSPCVNQPSCSRIGAQHAACDVHFVRGDVDGSGELDISDPIFSLAYQFALGPAPGCFDTADEDDSGEINISDPIASLMYQFAGGPPPRAPFPGCGSDPTGEDLLECGGFAPARLPRRQPRLPPSLATRSASVTRSGWERTRCAVRLFSAASRLCSDSKRRFATDPGSGASCAWRTRCPWTFFPRAMNPTSGGSGSAVFPICR